MPEILESLAGKLSLQFLSKTLFFGDFQGTQWGLCLQCSPQEQRLSIFLFVSLVPGTEIGIKVLTYLMDLFAGRKSILSPSGELDLKSRLGNAGRDSSSFSCWDGRSPCSVE